MANRKQLEEKFAKSQETVEKKRKTIERHEKALAKKMKALTDKGLDTSNLEAIKRDKDGNSTEHYWDVYEVQRKLDDIEGAKKNLRKAESVMQNWQTKLNAEIEKERYIEGNTPQVIKDFLEEWRKMAYEWHIKRYNDYLIFSEKLDKETHEARINCIKSTPEYAQYLDEDGEVTRRDLLNVFPRKPMEEYLKERKLDWKTKDNRKAHFAGQTVLHMATMRNEAIRLEWLENTLEQEKQRKMYDLINRIMDVTGLITDATNLKISTVGNLNGIIIGETAKAKVETISAGGWNIQCFHYRTLVKEVK